MKEALECCMIFDDEFFNDTVKKKQNIISGPKRCPLGKSVPKNKISKNEYKDLFSSKDMKS